MADERVLGGRIGKVGSVLETRPEGFRFWAGRMGWAGWLAPGLGGRLLGWWLATGLGGWVRVWLGCRPAGWGLLWVPGYKLTGLDAGLTGRRWMWRRF